MILRRSHVSFIDIGNMVVCDYCNTDYTESELSGGCLLGSSAVCPECIEDLYRGGDEPDLLCPEGMSFKEFVQRIRNGNNLITIETFDN